MDRNPGRCPRRPGATALIPCALIVAAIVSATIAPAARAQEFAVELREYEHQGCMFFPKERYLPYYAQHGFPRTFNERPDSAYDFVPLMDCQNWVNEQRDLCDKAITGEHDVLPAFVAKCRPAFEQEVARCRAHFEGEMRKCDALDPREMDWEKERKERERKRLAEQRREEERKRLLQMRRDEERKRLAEQRRDQERQRLADEQRREEERRWLADQRQRDEERQRLADQERRERERQQLAEQRRREQQHARERLAQRQRTQERERLAQQQQGGASGLQDFFTGFQAGMAIVQGLDEAFGDGSGSPGSVGQGLGSGSVSGACEQAQASAARRLASRNFSGLGSRCRIYTSYAQALEGVRRELAIAGCPAYALGEYDRAIAEARRGAAVVCN